MIDSSLSEQLDSEHSNCEQAQNLFVVVQYGLPKTESIPSEGSLINWASYAYSAIAQKASDVTIRLVEMTEIQQLNKQYRHKNKATNVLSFPHAEIPELDHAILGDIIVCHEVLEQEAKKQNKTLSDHYAHMITHGILHLCGYDHQTKEDAAIMEALEIRLLAEQGVKNPYQTHV